jgi:Ca2+-binding RTX toxin-like protein
MANHIITTSVTGNNITYTMGLAGEYFILTEDTRVIGTGYSYIYGTVAGVSATIDGYMWLQGVVSGFGGSPFYFTGGDQINIGASATLILESAPEDPFQAIMLGQGDGNAFVGGTTFNNDGSITMRVGGFLASGGDNQVSNDGTITLNNASMAFRSGSGDTLTNNGTIKNSSASGLATVFVETGDLSVENAGTILAQRTSSAAIQISNQVPAGLTTINNSGAITAVKGIAIAHDPGLSLSTLKVINTGTITGQSIAILGSAGADTVINRNTIIGDVNLGAGADTFDGRTGQVIGTIALGADSDVYKVSDAAIDLLELSNQGTDRVDSTVSFELGNNFEDLRLLGSAQEGVGNSLNNVITGNGFANTLLGYDGMDTLSGGAGADVLDGDAGNDILSGNDGADILSGGTGNDTMTGGVGADRFIFDTALNATTNFDIITGLSSIDRLVLDQDIFTAIGPSFTIDEFRSIATGTSFATVDANDYVVYLKSTGQIFYDQDGSGIAFAPVLFAELPDNTTLSFSNFLLVA